MSVARPGALHRLRSRADRRESSTAALRPWRRAAARHWPLACLIAALAAASAGTWHWQLVQRAGRAEAALVAWRVQEAAPRTPEPAAADAPDFARNLPETAPADAVARDLQRFSTSVGAVFVAVDVTPRAATTATLGRVDLSVTLRGEYPKLKAVLAQVLDRYPNLVVQRLSLRRAGSPADLEAAVALSLLSRPAPAPRGGS